MTLKNIRILLLLGVLLCTTFLRAQQSPKPYLLHWSEKDGLSDNNIYKVIKDRRGWLWIGSSNGLCRFDGKEFETFRYDPKDKTSVGANEVVWIMEAKNGNIWIGTDGGGLSVYDYTFNHFKTLRQDLDRPNLGLTEDRVFSFWEDASRDIITGYRAIGSGKGGLTVISEDLKIKEHLLRDSVDYAGFPLKVSCIFQSPSSADTYWLAGRSFFQLNRSNGQLEEFPHPSFIPNYTSVCGIAEESDSTLLVGLYFDGLWLFNKKSKQWVKPIHDQPIRSFFKGKDGKIWIADGVGIGWIDEQSKRTIYEIRLSGENSPFTEKVSINDIEMIDDNLWICTNKGLFCWSYNFQQFNVHSIAINEKERAHFPIFVGQLEANTWLFSDQKRGLLLTDSLMQVQQVIPMPNGSRFRKAGFSKNRKKPFVLIGGERGLFYWEAGDRQIQSFQGQSATVKTDDIRAWSIYLDDQDNAWVGTQASGLLKINIPSRQVTQYLHQANNPLSLCHNKYLFEIDQDQNGNLWICTDKGLSIIDPKSGKFLSYPALDPIQNYVLHCIEPDGQQNVWIGSRDQGLFQYNLQTQQLTNYSASDGLLYNGVNKMVREEEVIWLATREGLCKMDTRTEEIVRFDQKKGLYANTLYSSWLAKLPNNQVMLTYQNSDFFSTFQYQSLKEHFPPPSLDIQSIRILSSKEGKSFVAAQGPELRLNPNENYFAIDFKAIDFFNPRSIKYQYTLENYDDGWINAGATNTAIYTNLPGGDYQFKVKAANQDGQWSATKELSIQLATPWHKTGWFHALLAFSILGFITAVYRFRTQQILKEENFKRQLADTEMKALRAQINPHFIFNCLNSIKSYIIENKIEDGTEFIGRFSQLIRMILSHSKERLIPISKEIEAIKLYVWLEQERLKNKFTVDFKTNFSNTPVSLMIPPLLFQPYIENAIWHGLIHLQEHGHLSICMEELEESIQIQIADDGIGRKAASELKKRSVFNKPSMGLELSSHRLEQINKLYQLQSSVTIEDQFPDRTNTGTVVTIIFPKIKSPSHDTSDHH